MKGDFLGVKFNSEAERDILIEALYKPVFDKLSIDFKQKGKFSTLYDLIEGLLDSNVTKDNPIVQYLEKHNKNFDYSKHIKKPAFKPEDILKNNRKKISRYGKE